MKEFAQLVEILATSNKTSDKLNALKNYFEIAREEDKAWVIAIFTGRRPKRSLSGSLLSQWCIEIINIEPWLFDECYHTVGDFAETVSLLLPEIENKISPDYSLSHYINVLIKLDKQEESVKKKYIVDCWKELNKNEIFVFNKLITGSFRIGVSQKTMVNALAGFTNNSPSEIAHRISGKWDPSTISFKELISASSGTSDFSKPYPFYLAYAIDEENLNKANDNSEWQAEWKWDGIRGQIIKRNDELYVWSRGEELITEKFPEFNILKDKLPNGIVIDWEILCIKNTESGFIPLPFSVLQTRIGRKNITKKQLTEAPVGFIAYDLIEYDNKDMRDIPLTDRRKILEEIISTLSVEQIHISPLINFKNLEEIKKIRTRAQEYGSEGIMLKRKTSVYETGRKKGNWWKWKIDPLTIDAVMIYAQKGSGRRSNLYTDYTFAVKDGDKLVTFTKAYSGLTDKEFAQVDNFVKRNSLEKFGPVRTVKPELVFEIAFEGIAESKRHKSGVALRFPRMSRWRKDKKVEDINTLDDLKEILNNYNRQFISANENL
ncbi:MAG: ATP-dependent DNA ligase [Ferruginibacter sp.]